MASASHSSTTPAEGSARARTGSVRVNTVKATVADQIAQSVQSTSNLLHLMQQSSSSHILSAENGRKQVVVLYGITGILSEGKGEACLTKLPKNLLAKTSTIKNTEQLLEQMPSVISSLDAHVESGLQCVPHLKTVIQLLENMESCQLNPMSEVRLPEKEPERRSQPSAPS